VLNSPSRRHPKRLQYIVMEGLSSSPEGGRMVFERWEGRDLKSPYCWTGRPPGGAAVRRRTHDRKVAGSTPGPGAIKSTRSTPPSIPPG